MLYGLQSFDNIDIKLVEMNGFGQNIFKINLKENVLVIKEKLGQQYINFNIYILLNNKNIKPILITYKNNSIIE